MAAHHVDHTVVINRNRNHIGAQTRRLPKNLSGSGIVTAHFVGRGHDDLGATAVLDRERRAPRTRLVTLRAPQLFSVALVNGNHERAGLMIENQKQLIAKQQRRRAFAKREPHLHLHAEVFFPNQFSAEVVSIKTSRTKERVDIPAISNRRVRRKAAIRAVITFVRRRYLCGSLPENFARLAIETEHFEAMFDQWTSATTCATSLRRRGLRRFRRLITRNRRREKYVVARDNRPGETALGNRCLPLVVLRFPPNGRRIATSHAVE